MYFIGLDLGSSSIKVLVTNEEGVILSSATEYVSTYSPKPTFREQDPLEVYNKAILAMKVALSVFPKKIKVEAIGLSGQMMGMVCLDRKTEPILNFFTWEDQRSYEYCVPNENFSMITRNMITPAHWLPKLGWMRKNCSNEYSSIDKLVFVKDYIRYRLTGILGLERSELLGSYLFDVVHNEFSEELLNTAGISKHSLPDILYDSFDVVGYLKDDISVLLDIEKSKVLVIAGGADIAMSAIAHGAIDNNTIGISIGTSGAVYRSCEELPNGDICALYTMMHSLKDKYLNYGITINACASLDWISRLLFDSVEVSKILEKVKQCDRTSTPLLFLPYLNGERSPINDVNAKGTFFGLSQATSKLDMILSVLEGVAFSFKDVSTYFDIKKFTKIVVSGGGSTSQLWCQIISDVMNAQVVSLEQKDASAIGAIITATCSAGTYSSIQDAIKNITTLKVRANPQPRYVEYYSQLFDVYKSLYTKTKELVLSFHCLQK